MAAELAQRTIIFVPFPALGHIIPMLHLARALVDGGDHVSVTVAVPDFIHRRMGQYSIPGVTIESISSGIVLDDEAAPGPAMILHAMEHHMPAQLESMLTAHRRISCLVVDLLASWAIPLAAQRGLPAVGFWPGMVATYRTVVVIPELVGTDFISDSGIPNLQTAIPYNRNEGTLLAADGTCEDHFDKEQNIGDHNILPAKLGLRFKHLPWLVDSTLPQQSRISFWLRTVDRAKSLPSIFFNSFSGEGSSDESNQYNLPKDQQILHVGPLLFNDTSKTTTSMWQADLTCMEWLDNQSPGSVVYVSFGSWASPVEPDKIAGFAHGLEACGRPFLWVLRDHPLWRAGLPDDYIDRISSRGRIISWAPQDDVLQHEAVGCYIIHCGWNSVLEAVRHGVRMMCYPITADHFINCAYVINMFEIGIALASSDQSDVKDCIERVMEGEEGRRLQQKVNELRETITVGEAMCVAKRDLNLFMEKMINTNNADDEDIKIGQGTLQNKS
ncbi:hypothetical protein U9M48_014080 [Paspalum notatum var. saurae]|uniref:Glycosyltransferase n=1 Tax=Paspalum notatum var. saurae TaxID=547442 RepID=A0AAQ3WK82_PASNO